MCTFHVLGPSGTPHESLSVGSNEVNDLPDLGFKAHVEHAVRLVQHKVGAALHVGLARIKEVNQPARSRYDNVTTCGGSMKSAGET